MLWDGPREGIPARGTLPEVRSRKKGVAALLLLWLLLPACASSKKQERPWKPGDSIICPNCGREFQVPEKLGP